MEKGIKLHRALIDELVAMHLCVHSQWVLREGYPQVEGNEPINAFLQKLSLEDKQVLAVMLQDAYDSGTYETLYYLDEKMEGDGLTLVQDGTAYITDAYNSMHVDFVCRVEGDAWPDEYLTEN